VTDNRALRRITGKKIKKDEYYIMRNIIILLLTENSRCKDCRAAAGQ